MWRQDYLKGILHLVSPHQIPKEECLAEHEWHVILLNRICTGGCRRFELNGKLMTHLCSDCQKPLCIGSCFQAFHTNSYYRQALLEDKLKNVHFLANSDTEFTILSCAFTSLMLVQYALK